MTSADQHLQLWMDAVTRAERAEERVAELEADLAEYRRGETVYLTDSGAIWKDGDPEPPRMIHALGSPDCVEALRVALRRIAAFPSEGEQAK